MTFKHTKFEDSAVMRSLEKLSREKSPAPALTKTASKSVDLHATSSLMENVLNLCAGLKDRGLTKYAEELETKYLNYKYAQTLYETCTEKGEDLVDAAHPKGSHKLENVEGDEAVIETIVDQHLKMLEKTNKKPTGKLSDAASIISAVKVVLGQETAIAPVEVTSEDPATAFDNLRKLYAQGAIKPIAKMINDASKIMKEKTSSSPFMKAKWWTNHKEVMDDYNTIMSNTSAVTVDSLENLITDLKDLSNAVSFFTKKDLWALVSPAALLQHTGDAVDWVAAGGDFQSDIKGLIAPKVNDALNLANYALEYIQNKHDDVIQSSEKKKNDDLQSWKGRMLAKISQSIATLKQYQSKILQSNYPANSKKEASAWIANQLDELTKINIQTDAVDSWDDVGNINKALTTALEEGVKFYTDWVKPIL